MGPLGRAWWLGDAGDVVVELRRGCLQNEASNEASPNEATTVPSTMLKWRPLIPGAARRVNIHLPTGNTLHILILIELLRPVANLQGRIARCQQAVP